MPEKIKQLVAGYKKFHDEKSVTKEKLFKDLAVKGQYPKALVISCADSRVDPALLMNCQPGDLFVVRNVANLVPPYENDDSYHGTSAALEFAVLGLGIKHIIILGHSGCGGIKYLVENDIKNNNKKSFVGKWMEIAHASKIAIEDSVDSSISHEEKINCCAQESIINSIKNLGTFPWIKEKVEEENLFLHGWFFDIEEFGVRILNSETRKFDEVK